MGDFISFKKMITPTIIRVIFWIGIVFAILAGLGMIIGGISSDFGGGGAVLAGLAWIVFGPILVRIYCEILIVIFSIHDRLGEIRDALGNR